MADDASDAVPAHNGDDEEAEVATPVGAGIDVDRRYGAIIGDSRGQVVLHCTAGQWLEVATAARDDGFDQLIDLTAVDYSAYRGVRDLPDEVAPERFEVVVGLLSLGKRERVRVRAQVSESNAEVPSLFDLWPGSEALEREAYDMFGVIFTDHPDLSRILMPEDWVGYPLRKDFEVGTIPVQFKAASNEL